MTKANTQKQLQEKGKVRIRSNVCTNAHSWELVPGDVLKLHGLHYDISSGTKQHDEMMYYERCCRCHRTVYEIKEDGCDQGVCRASGTLSSADAARRKKRLLNNADSVED
ncbi:MAG: hypothetical protein ACLFVO_14145 [Chloroflexaceae bacterium]